MTPLKGSHRNPPPGATELGPTPPDEALDVTVRVRRRSELPPVPARAELTRLNREEYEARHGAAPEDIQQVEDYARKCGLKVEDSSAARGSLLISGTASAFNAAFNCNLKQYRLGEQVFRGRSGPVYIPRTLEGIITGVFGLSNETFARPHFRARAQSPHPTATMPAGFTPLEIARRYNFPPGLDGQGQTIGIIELGGGFRQDELDTYFKQLGVAPPPVKVAQFAGSGSNSPGSDPLDPNNPDLEVMLDLQVAAAVAPGAQIVVYFAPSAEDQSFLDAMTAAVHDAANQPTVISISWGGSEAAATSQFLTNFDQVLQAAAHLGITVCVASGDNASADAPADDPSDPWDGQAHVDFPASSPFALGCGGTRINPDGAEVTWHPGPNQGTGGGISRAFPVPDYQANAGVPLARNPPGPAGRGVPDVSGDAAQESGYQVLCDGLSFPDPAHNPPLPPIGGTSAVAPLWAGLTALINQGLGRNVGFVQPSLYPLGPSAGAFQDITSGDNGDYQAGPGWDPCTGLGVPDGQKLLAALGAGPLSQAGPAAPAVFAPRISTVASPADSFANIEHVFVLMLENRAFDHMLGYSAITGTDAVTGSPTQMDGLPPGGAVNYDTDQTPYQTASPAPFRMPVDPPHEYDFVRLQLLGSNGPTVNYNNTAITNAGFVLSYKTAAAGHPLGDVMACFDPAQLPVLNALAREFCLCDRWFSSLPGPTIPNRLFLHAATCGGDPTSPSAFSLARAEIDGSVSYKFVNGNVFQRMDQRGIPWALYHGDTFAVTYALDGVSFGAGIPFDPRKPEELAQFRQDLDNPNLPNYIFIEPNWGNLLLGTYEGGNSQHPMDDVTSGEALVKAVYEAIRASSCWASSVLIVTYDEHGGFFDHAIPPSGVPAPQDVPPKFQFDFTQLGVRVPAVIISPWIPRNLIDHTVYDHTSVLATLRTRFPALGFFTRRDQLANDLSHLFSLPQPREDAPLVLPNVAASGLAAARLASIDTASEAAFQSFPGAAQPVESTQVGFLHVALKLHLELASPKDRRSILQAVGNIRTQGETKQYLRDVRQLLEANRTHQPPLRHKTAKPSRPVSPKSKAAAPAKRPASRKRGTGR